MFGVSAIHAAHFTGRPDLVSLLRQPDRPDAFVLSVELGEFEVVESALKADPLLATRYDDAGSTALHGACYWGQTRVAELLIRAGADVSAATRDNFLQVARSVPPSPRRPASDSPATPKRSCWRSCSCSCRAAPIPTKSGSTA